MSASMSSTFAFSLAKVSAILAAMVVLPSSESTLAIISTLAPLIFIRYCTLVWMRRMVSE